MASSIQFEAILIAPCGMNCGTCMAFLREKNKCPGCRIPFEDKSKTRVRCIIKNCPSLQETTSKFCYECEKFPCKRLKQLDKRYRTKYHVSFIQNLLKLNDIGIQNYLAEESNRWTCPNCGSVICVHRDNCPNCKNKIQFDSVLIQ
jgi:rubredoxin